MVWCGVAWRRVVEAVAVAVAVVVVVAAEKLPQVGVSSNMTLLFFGCTAEAEAKRLFTTQEFMVKGAHPSVVVLHLVTKLDTIHNYQLL